MKASELWVEFECEGYWMAGILHLPDVPRETGIVVIGRTGSDRLSVHLGRAAAERGIALFRFDLRGRGDCEGPAVSVEQTGMDLDSAIGAFLGAAPGVRSVAVWGLSEGAAAALLHGPCDPRASGLILVNLWIRMERQVAREHVRQNLTRLFEAGFWNRIRKSEAGFRGAVHTFGNMVRNAIYGRAQPESSLKEKLMKSLGSFRGPVLLVLREGDPATAVLEETAKLVFEQLKAEGRLTVRKEPEANHVFSRSDWRAHLIDWCLDWVTDRDNAS